MHVPTSPSPRRVTMEALKPLFSVGLGFRSQEFLTEPLPSLVVTDLRQLFILIEPRFLMYKMGICWSAVRVT